MILNKNKIVFLSFTLFSYLITWNNPIFWDNITFISDMGNALYENGIFNWLSITPEIDPGHPPFMAFLVTLVWSVFGKSLWVTHILMLPFVYGFLLQLSKFIAYFFKDKVLKIAAFILVLIDPTLLAQLVSVNPEVPLLFFFFLALNGILYKNNTLKIIGLMLVSIVSYRGMMLGVGLFIVDLLLHVIHRRESIFSFFKIKTIIIYIISSIPAACYIGWRLVYKGWLISNPLQPWGSATDYTDNSGFTLNFLRNVLVLVHRYVDFGRIFLFLIIIYICFRFWKKIDFTKIRPLLIISTGSVIIIIITSLSINNPMGHRYFIPSYLGFALMAFVLLKQLYLTHTHSKIYIRFAGLIFVNR